MAFIQTREASKMQRDRRLILGSGSPRRRDLLLAAGYEFEVETSAAEEIHDCAMSPQQLTTTNAFFKAMEVARRFPESIVIGADTLVYLDREPLGKPADLAQAREMLCRLTGRTHEVCTGVALVCRSEDWQRQFHVITEVTFRDLKEDEIEEYLALIDPLDKAGAYAAQEHGEKIIAGMVGSESNVIGLPMEELGRALREIGIVGEGRGQ